MAIPDRDRAEHEAAKVLQDRGITTLPVDPVAIARSRGIEVRAKPDTARGVSGLLVQIDQSFGIMYATHIPSEGFQRFSIAHELGHYFLPGHVDAIFSNGSVHQSHAGFISQDPYEMEADYFAAALLMPDPVFRSAVTREKEDGLAGIENLRRLCRTSLTATAIRYIDRTSIPTAIVVSVGQRIDFGFLSPALKEFRNLEWPRKHSPLPANVLTQRFNQDHANGSQGNRDEGTSDLRDWFGGSRSIEVREEVIGLGACGKTLTILTSDTFADEVEEEERIEESWRPKWR